MLYTSCCLNNGAINRDGFLLQYRIEGQGPTAMVIGSVNQYPQTFSDSLREQLQLVFIDHRAFVPVPTGLEQAVFDLDTILSDIDKMRQTLNLDRVIIVGHSGHAYMALEYAKKYSTYVSHVVMIAISPSLNLEYRQAAGFYWQDFASNKRKIAHARHLEECPEERLLNLSPSDRFIREYIRNSAKIWYDFETNAAFLWKNVSINLVIFNHLWHSFREIDLTKGLDNFNMPVFLAMGLYDFAVAPFVAWYPIRDKFKNFTLSLFKKSGHTPQLEESDIFNARLLQWIKQNY